MSRQLFISNLFCISGSLVIFFLLSTNVFSAEETNQRSTGAEKIKGPITITSKMLTADDQSHTALFENSVVAKTTDMTIYADRMLVYYNKDTGNVTQIDAKGDVKLIKENRLITSSEATYYTEGEKVIFTGTPRALEGENVVTGSKMTYLLDEDRFLVEGSKVFLKKRK
jgi:lipopolysaccharide export system protein LptA